MQPGPDDNFFGSAPSSGEKLKSYIEAEIPFEPEPPKVREAREKAKEFFTKELPERIDKPAKEWLNNPLAAMWARQLPPTVDARREIGFAAELGEAEAQQRAMGFRSAQEFVDAFADNAKAALETAFSRKEANLGNYAKVAEGLRKEGEACWNPDPRFR